MLPRGPEEGCPSGRTIGRLVRWHHPGEIRTYFLGVTNDGPEEGCPSGRTIGRWYNARWYNDTILERSGPISKGGVSTYCGAKCSLGCTSLPPKNLYWLRSYGLHSGVNGTWQRINREDKAGESCLLTKGDYDHMEEKDGSGHSYQYREGEGKAENGLAWILAHNCDKARKQWDFTSWGFKKLREV